MDSQNAKATAGYAVNLSLIQLISRTLPALIDASPNLISHADFGLAFGVGYIATFFLLILRGLVNCPLRKGAYFITFLCLIGGSCIVIALDSEAAAWAGNILFGVGAACSFTLWQQMLCTSPTLDPLRVIILGSALASFIWIPSLFLDRVGSIVLLLIAIALNAILLWDFCTKTARLGSNGKPLIVSFVRPNTVRRLIASLWRYILCVATIGITCRMSRFLVASDTSALILNIVYSVGMILPALVLLLMGTRSLKMPSFNLVYSFFMLFSAMAFILLPFLGSEYRIAMAAVTYLAFSLASMFVVITTVNTAKARETNPTLVFALFAFPMYAISDGARLLFQAAGGFVNMQGIPQIVVGSLFVIYCLSFTGVIVSLSKKSGSDDTDADADVAIVESDAPAPASGDRENAQASTEPASHERFERDIVVKEDMIPACCEAIQKNYGLTERQTEVLELIARGRDVSRIADALCVSYHTAKSHCRNLYLKLDVHSKQEILDLLEHTKSTL